MKNIVKPFITFLVLVVMGVSTNAQNAEVSSTPDKFIKVDINSGNPACPFPQFLEYKKGRTLAKYNAEGVTHADMEKAMRDAYTIMTHRCRYYGEHCGVKYITFNQTKLSASSKDYPEVPSNWGHFCTEGDGYILLAAAIFADQKTYNGLYMWLHDNRMSNVKRYQDGRMLRPDYRYGKHIVGWENDETTPNGNGMNDGATDGDVDIAMAAYIAYKQWGEFMMQDGKVVKDSDGNPISLKEEAREAIKSLVDTFWVPFQEGITYNADGTRTGMGFSSGDIGFDGYVKGGCTWGEISQWTMNNGSARWNWLTGVATGGNMQNHIDYNSVAYFNEFWKWLEDQSEEGGQGNEWEVSQMKRAQASSEWLNEQAYKKGYYPSIGWVGMETDGQPTFAMFSDGEDFRYAWRHLIQYMWHGETELGWDPKTHEVIDPAGGDDYNYLMAERMSGILINPVDASGKPICGALGASPDPGQHAYSGIAHLNQCYDLNGLPMTPHHTNYTLGAAASAAVIMGEEYPDLLADVYRQCELKWDDASYVSRFTDKSYRYENSTPSYFHGWFRTLGMITTSGNLLAPSEMYPRANVKVYMSVDKTYAYVDDKVDYSVQYRNYGSKDAEDVVITTPLDKDYQFVSATKGGVYNASTHTITWNIGKISGFKSGKLNETMDSVAFTVLVADTVNKRACLVSTITGSNFEEWVSNEYPNHATYTMERNCVDILKNRSLTIKKTANREKMNPKDIVKFTVEFENLSGGADSWLNGGRKYVGISYGNYLPNGLDNEGDWTNTTFYQYYRFWNEAQEAYINMGNYRVSYFMNDINRGFKSADNPNGWLFGLDNENDVAKYGYFPESGGADILYQKIPAGSDEFGSWNQRFVIKFPDVLTTASSYIFDKLDGEQYMHKGVVGPGLYRSALKTDPATNMKFKVEDDWSYSPELQNGAHTVDMGTYTTTGDPLSGQSHQFIPITPNYADYNYPDGVEVTNYDRFACKESVKGYDRVLVEEFDGYTWRRILGKGPLPGKEAYDVVVVDTLPAELEWKGFIDSLGLGVKAQFISPEKSNTPSGVVYWTIPEMLVGEKDKLIYEAIAKDMGCPDADDANFLNVAWISSKTDSPDSSQVNLMITCAELPPIVEPQNVVFKECNRKFAEVGDTISYTLKFINNMTSIVLDDLENDDYFIPLGKGKVPKVSNGSVSCDQNKNQGINPPYFFSHGKAYGKDVTFETTWDISNSSEFYFVFRYTSGTPYSSDFKGICLKVSPIPAGDGTIKFEVLDGTKVVATETHNVACPAKENGKFNPTDFRIELKDGTMYIYVNDMETVLKSYTGITTMTPGYVGVYSGPQGNQNSMTKYYVEQDYAFEINMMDNLPKTKVMENGTEKSVQLLRDIHNISGNGTYSGGWIQWPSVCLDVEHALAPGDSVVYTFDAVVDQCDKYISNSAMACFRGRPYYEVVNTINCGTSCELESAEITLNDCECDSAHIGVETNAPGSYYYTLYKGDEKVAKSTKNSFSVAEEGKYHVVVTSTNDDQCMASTSEVYVGITKTPVGEDFIIGPICAGTKAEDNQKFSDAVSALKAFEEQNVRVLWFDAAGDPLTEMPNPDVLEAGSYEFTYWLSRSCCAGEPYQFTFTKADTAVVKLSDLTICAGQSGTLSVDKVAGYSYLWSDGSTENELVTDQAGTYKVTVTTADGCLSTAQASIKVEDKLVVDLGKDTTICSANLPLVLDASSSYDTYLWNDNSTGSTLEVTESGEYEVAVTQGSCDGGGKITVTVAESPVLEGTFDVSYMLSDTAANGQFDKSLTEYDASVLKKDPNFTYVWFDMDSKELSSEPIPSVITDGTPEIFYVKAVNGNCESELQKIKVQVISSPMPKAEDVNYCLNDEAQPLTAEAMDDGSGAVWTLTWYDADGNVLADAPKPSTAVAGETLYYVTQKDQNDVEGAKRKVTVTVYALPEVEAIEPIKKSCEEKILLNPLFTEKTGVAKYYMHYFDPEGENMYGMYNCIDCTEDAWATYSGTYSAWVYYYPITGLRCGSADKASIEIAIDTLKEFKVTASPSVCPFGEVEFSASASAGDAAVEYQWSGDAIGNEATLKVKDVDGIYGTTYSYKLNVIAGECQKDTTLTLTVGRGELTGALSANGEETKEFRTCGGEDIILSTTHEGSDFKWSTLDGTLLEESQTVTVTPSASTTYVLSFVNKCETSDTIKVEVLPISLTTDFSLLNTSVCEGEKASGTLTITGYDETMSGSYIKWFKDGVELPAFAGKSELSIESATTADAGTYTYEVSNGICLAKTTAGDEQAKLEVKPFVSFSMPDKVLAANGSSASLSLSDLIPSDAQVSWQGTVNSGSGNPFEIAEVTTSELFDIKVTADGYCERDTQLQLLVDAKVIVSASTTTPVVCQGDYVTLIADTTGTGLLLNPSDYKVTWYVAEEGGEFTSMQTSQLEIKNAPDTNVSYFAVVTYGDQVANSDTVPVTILSPLSYTKTVDTVSCSGAEIALNVTIDDDHGNAYEIKWEDGTTGSDLNVTPTVATDYAFTITQMDGLCPMTDKVHVSVKENPSIEMEDDVMICSGSSVTLDPTVSGDDIDSYAWVGPDGDTLDTSKKLTLEDASTGEYKLIVASASCGSASASQNVTVIPTPEVTIDSINFVTRRIVATGSSSSYEYKVDNGAWNTVDTFQSYIFDIPHTAFVRDDHGCEGLTLFTIIAPPVPIPEYFVPGSGSEHDSWDLTPIMEAYPTSTVKIYDRTGKVVAELDGDTADWDGTYNGYPLPSTDYWYVLNVPEIRKQFTGHFTLIRSK